MAEAILVERSGNIARVILNRPEKHNAFTLAMYEAFRDAFVELNRDSSIRCIIVTGAGGRAFCTGSDIAQFDEEREGSAKAEEYARFTFDCTDKLRQSPHPTIAVIAGLCVGGGVEIAAMCDFRLCTPDSRFGIPANRIGLTLDYDELQAILELVRPRDVLELVLEGRLIDADDAKRRGLVSRIEARDAINAATQDLAERISAGAPLSNRFHKAAIRRLFDPTPLTAAERRSAFACYESEDYRIGRLAFASKTAPEFVGR
jgi:enoyl-CoA hydratase/carnithine racemase